MMVGIVLWFLLGIVTGILLAFILYKGGRQVMPLTVLGVVGALIGGSFGQILSAQSRFNVATVFISILGALILIAFYKNISPQN